MKNIDQDRLAAREKVKSLSTKEKIKYFFYYYWIHTLVAIIIISAVVGTVINQLTQVHYDLSVSSYATEGITDEFAEKAEKYLNGVVLDISGDKKTLSQINVNIAPLDDKDEYSRATMYKLSLEMASGEYMAMFADKTYYDIIMGDVNETVEKSVEVTKNKALSEKLGLNTEHPVYFIVKVVYDTQKKDKEKLAEHENALKVYEEIKKGLSE